MSSNRNINTPLVTRHNYEAFFCMYADAELTPQEVDAVEAFAAQHPELKAELDALCSTRLPAEEITFLDKDSLLAHRMQAAAAEENLLLFLDNELEAPAAAALAAQLQTNAALAQQFELLQKTKLDTSENICYPAKAELLRHTERRLVPFWMRVAAAVLLLAGGGTAAWLGNTTTAPVRTPPLVVTTPAPKSVAAPPVNFIPEKATEERTENVALATPEKTANRVKPHNRTAAAPPPALATAKPNALKTFSNPHTTAKEAAVVAHKRNVTTVPVVALLSKPRVNNLVVTSETAATYVPVDAAQTQVPVYAATATDDPQQGGGMKGFLRKATRFIERRTGIKAVNDDDELLVGAVALKL